MERTIKIVSITNCHVWDEVSMPETQFDNLINLLYLSPWVHKIEIILGGTNYEYVITNSTKRSCETK